MIITHVHEPATPYSAGDVAVDLGDPTEESLRERLAEVTPTDASVPHRHLLLYGDPISQIVHAAEEQRVDMIVMGTHGRTGLTRLLMGSVAEAVVRRAACPVLIVKHFPSAD